MTLTNVSASAVNTIRWLDDPGASLVVPVYQREYRWEADSCERLLADVRAAAGGADGEPASSHFLGSILFSTPDPDERASGGEVAERMLVDGQQRIASLLLLLAAVRDTLTEAGQLVPDQVESVLRHPGDWSRPRLRLRDQGKQDLTLVLIGAGSPGSGEVSGADEVNPVGETTEGESHVLDNYSMFREEVRDDALKVWDGMQRLEHVAIILRPGANAQQVFESLNSTGAPLRNHELIHNYILMGRSDQQQVEIQEEYWRPITDNTREELDDFLRDYLILRTGRDSQFSGDRGLYEVFRSEFPARRLAEFADLREQAAEWKRYSEVYQVLLQPELAGDPEITRELSYIQEFGAAMYPLLLGVYRDYRDGRIQKSALLEVLKQLQSLYLRKMVVGASRDRLAAQLVRKWRQHGFPIRSIVSRMPSDDRVRHALQYRSLPHPGYVLRRIEANGVDDQADLVDSQVEHIFPQTPKRTWTGDGERRWSEFREEERAKYREVLDTIGNLALLEGSLNAGASNKSFQQKKAYFRKSAVGSTRELADLDCWDLAAIECRANKLTDGFLTIWQRPEIEGIDDPEFLVPILDAVRKPGYYKGWKTEFEYAVFQGEVWEVRNIKELFQQMYIHLWMTRRAELRSVDAAGAATGYSVIRERGGKRIQGVELPGSHFLYMGWFPQYLLDKIQHDLGAMGLADEVFVKYSSDEA